VLVVARVFDEIVPAREDRGVDWLFVVVSVVVVKGVVVSGPTVHSNKIPNL